MNTIQEDRTFLPKNDGDQDKSLYAFLSKNDLDDSRAPAYKLVADGAEIDLPQQMAEILAQAAFTLAQGQAVSVISHDKYLTTSEAAELLGLSRPTVVKLCDEGKLAFSRANSHRRLRLRDVIHYRDKQRNESAKALDELASESEQMEAYSLTADEIKEALATVRKKKD